MLAFKPDWEQSQKRIMAWWEREVVDRAVIQVRAPRDGESRVLPPDDLEQRWTDIDYVLDAAEERMRRTWYGGDAFPCFYPNLGPDIFAGFLGCEIQFGEHTSWSVPILETWDGLESLRLHKEAKWWRLIQEMLERGGQRFQGKAILGYTDLHGGGDLVAALRDPQNLAFDLLDHPDQVERAMEIVEPMWVEALEAEMDVIRRYSHGASTWMNLWHPGTWFPVSCDFICMVSGPMFERFFLPELVAEIEYLDRSIFHLDGPDALKHLGRLLEIEKLDAIQWVPGANSGPIAQWFPMLKRIQGAGKGLQLHIEPNEVEGVMTTLSSRGLCITTHAGSVEEADALVAQVAALTRD